MFRRGLPLLFCFVICGLLSQLISQNAYSAEPPQSPEIQKILKPYIDRGELAGAILIVADKEQVLSQTIVGYADIENQKPMTQDSFFWIASMTKPFTAVAVMMLVEEGKINLDDPVEKYIPALAKWKVLVSGSENIQILETPNQKPTVRHLLSHTSGLAFIPEIEEMSGIDVLPLDRSSLASVTGPLLYQPGKEYRYSNKGIDIAGRIIEIASGMPYQDFMQQRIFDPLAMHDTTFWPDEQQLARLAKSYDLDQKPISEVRVSFMNYPLSDRTKRYPCPGGGLFTSGNDLVHFGQMLINNGTFQGKQLLSPASIAEIRKDQTGELKLHYGLCVGTFDVFFGHGGAHGTQILVSPERNRVVIYLVQAVNGKVGAIWDEVHKKAFEIKSSGYQDPF